MILFISSVRLSSHFLFINRDFHFAPRILFLHLKMISNTTMKLALLVCFFAILCQLSSARLMRPRRAPLRSHGKPRLGDDRCRLFRTLTQRVDHFGFVNKDTFEQRYTMNLDYWESGKPIFFYAGNEGSLMIGKQHTILCSFQVISIFSAIILALVSKGLVLLRCSIVLL